MMAYLPTPVTDGQHQGIRDASALTQNPYQRTGVQKRHGGTLRQNGDTNGSKWRQQCEPT
jgi:hypothetical protein